LFLLNRETYAQVNTESLRSVDIVKGFYNTMPFDFGRYFGNSDFLSLKGGIRSDFRTGIPTLLASCNINAGFKPIRYLFNLRFQPVVSEILLFIFKCRGTEG